MKLVDWLSSIASTLNDAEPGKPFQRYTVADMLVAYNQAVSLAMKHRPDLFTDLRIITLRPGIHQDARGCCENVLDVLEQVDAQGNVIRVLRNARPRTTTVKRVWNKNSCLPKPEGQDYVIQNVDIDRNLNGRFTVWPAPPIGGTNYVRVKCIAYPCSLSEAQENEEIDDTSVANVASWHYVLAQMLAGDRLASAGGGDKKFHYSMFFNVLGIVQKQEIAIESKEEA